MYVPTPRTHVPKPAEAGRPLVPFRPPKHVQLNVKNRASVGGYVQPIEKGLGMVNLDLYEVEITKLPKVGTVQLTGQSLFDRVRDDINSFLAPNTCDFEPWESQDASTWRTTRIGAVFHINMGSGISNLDDGAVVCGATDDDHWIFSTIYAKGDFTHPVSGCRQFGYYKVGGGETIRIFTRAADRVTDSSTPLVSDKWFTSKIFAGGHAVWIGLQAGLVAFVKNHGGDAVALPHTSERHDWEAIRRKHHDPIAKEPWF